MLAAVGGPPTAWAHIQGLIDDAHRLRARLERAAVAMTVTEERIADMFDRLAAQGGPSAFERRLLAKRAREEAETFRNLAVHLLQIGDTQAPPPDSSRDLAAQINARSA